MPGPARKPLSERFWPKVDKRGPDECWPWTGCAQANGYGQVNLGGRGGKRAAAHRVAYELCVGPIPEGHDLDHLCENKACVNPAHLEPVTRQDNMLRFHGQRTECRHGHSLDGVVRGTNPQGEHALYRYCRTCSRLGNRRRAKAARREVALEER